MSQSSISQKNQIFQQEDSNQQNESNIPKKYKNNYKNSGNQSHNFNSNKKCIQENVKQNRSILLFQNHKNRQKSQKKNTKDKGRKQFQRKKRGRNLKICKDQESQSLYKPLQQQQLITNQQQTQLQDYKQIKDISKCKLQEGNNSNSKLKRRLNNSDFVKRAKKKQKFRQQQQKNLLQCVLNQIIKNKNSQNTNKKQQDEIDWKHIAYCVKRKKKTFLKAFYQKLMYQIRNTIQGGNYMTDQEVICIYLRDYQRANIHSQQKYQNSDQHIDLDNGGVCNQQNNVYRSIQAFRRIEKQTKQIKKTFDIDQERQKLQLSLQNLTQKINSMNIDDDNIIIKNRNRKNRRKDKNTCKKNKKIQKAIENIIQICQSQDQNQKYHDNQRNFQQNFEQKKIQSDQQQRQQQQKVLKKQFKKQKIVQQAEKVIKLYLTYLQALEGLYKQNQKQLDFIEQGYDLNSQTWGFIAGFNRNWNPIAK